MMVWIGFLGMLHEASFFSSFFNRHVFAMRCHQCTDSPTLHELTLSVPVMEVVNPSGHRRHSVTAAVSLPATGL